MNKLRIILTLSILICLIYNANANTDELVEYEVYYNDQTATVFDADLKVGEPAIIKAVVYLKSTDSECSISLKSGRSDNIIIDMI